VSRVHSVVVSTAKVDASIMVGIASVEVIESVDAKVETGIVGVAPSFSSVVVSIADLMHLLWFYCVRQSD
jgi:hypothetical protein